MSPDEATAFARETAAAIRRALVPVQERLARVGEMLGDVLTEQDTLAGKAALEEASGKVAADLTTLREWTEELVETQLDRRDIHNAGVENQRLAELRAWAEAQVAESERTTRVALGEMLGETLATLDKSIATLREEMRAAVAEEAAQRVAAVEQAGAVAGRAAVAVDGLAAGLDARVAALLAPAEERLRGEVAQVRTDVAADLTRVHEVVVAEGEARAAVERGLATMQAALKDAQAGLTKFADDLLARVADSVQAVAKDAATDFAQLRDSQVALDAELRALLAAELRARDAALDERIDKRLAALEERAIEMIRATAKEAALSMGAAFEQLRADPNLRGPVGEGFRYREVFDAKADYQPGDWVTHDGTLWAAIAPSQGMVPGTDGASASWRMALKRARDGVNGVGMNWRGAYTEGDTYRINDVVRHMGRVLLCRRTTTAPPPIPGGAPATEWAVMLEPGQ